MAWRRKRIAEIDMPGKESNAAESSRNELICREAEEGTNKKEGLDMPHPGKVAKCPYYIRENQITIFCESSVKVMDGEKEGYQAHMFKNKEEKIAYIEKHCSRYPDMDCPYANHMDRYYEENERGRKKHEITDKTEAGRTEKRKTAGKNRCVGAGKRLSVRLM